MTESVENKDDSIAADSSSIVAGGEFVAEEDDDDDDDDDDDGDTLPRRTIKIDCYEQTCLCLCRAEICSWCQDPIVLTAPPAPKMGIRSDSASRQLGRFVFRPVLRCRILQPGKHPGERPLPVGSSVFFGLFLPGHPLLVLKDDV